MMKCFRKWNYCEYIHNFRWCLYIWYGRSYFFLMCLGIGSAWYEPNYNYYKQPTPPSPPRHQPDQSFILVGLETSSLAWREMRWWLIVLKLVDSCVFVSFLFIQNFMFSISGGILVIKIFPLIWANVLVKLDLIWVQGSTLFHRIRIWVRIEDGLIVNAMPCKVWRKYIKYVYLVAPSLVWPNQLMSHIRLH